jgi:hypothetical protein
MALRFKRVTEYLEDLMTFIDTPQLNSVDITFFNEIDFDCRRLVKFIGRTPKLKGSNQVHVLFEDDIVSVALRYQMEGTGQDERCRVQRLSKAVSCREPD